MATIKRTNIAPLNDQLTVTISKEDYLSTYETTLKKQAKTANIPGFRKGMVPAGMIKKMYGQAVFTDVILKSVEQEMNQYISKEQIDILHNHFHWRLHLQIWIITIQLIMISLLKLD